MGVQCFLTTPSSTIYEFDDCNGPRRWDAFEWATQTIDEPSNPVRRELSRDDLCQLRQRLVQTVHGTDEMDHADKARRIARDDAGINAALTLIDRNPIYFYAAY